MLIKFIHSSTLFIHSLHLLKKGQQNELQNLINIRTKDRILFAP